MKRISPNVSVVIDKLDAVGAALKAMAAKQVMVGFPAATTDRQPAPGETSGATNAQLAYIHNFGAPEAGIPPREFMESGIKPALPEVARRLKIAGEKAMAGDASALDDGLNASGLVASAAIKKKLIDGPFVPLAESTIAARERRGRKPPFKPLIDTGQLKNAVTYVLRRVKG